MTKKRVVSWLQDGALVVLALCAVFLVSRITQLQEGLSGVLLSGQDSGGGQQQSGDLIGTLAFVHLVVTDDSEYGRCSLLYTATDDPRFQQMEPLFREALGSALEAGMTADRTMQAALDTSSIYMDLTTALPLDIVAAWLGGETAESRMVRSLALTTEEDMATLYLCGGDGTIFRYETALPSTAVWLQTGSFAPNGGCFAYESNYGPLAAYTVLVAQLPPIPAVNAALPAGYSSYNLLTALDFNAHTNSRYTESGGVEVVVESPRTLRVSPEGTVSYSTDGDPVSPLYQVPCQGEAPTGLEVLQAAGRLADALTGATDAAPLYLRAVTAGETGWNVSFAYEALGMPVYFQDGGEALSITVEGQRITAFTYRCRTYLSDSGDLALLPPAMATAIASLRPGAGLAIGYVDNGDGALTAEWLVE